MNRETLSLIQPNKMNIMNHSPGNLPDAIIFDLDNTLCTFTDAKKAACSAVVDYISTGTAEELFTYFLRPIHGFEDPRHIHDFLHDKGLYSEDLIAEVTDLFEKIKISHIHPYEGVLQSLKSISMQGIPMAIVTDAGTFQAKKRLSKCNLTGFFQVLVTPDMTGTRKPDHTPFLHALQDLKVTSSNVWLVGDSIRREMIPGNELGYTTVYARYGDWTGGCDEEKPVYTIDRFSELLDLLGFYP